MENGKWHENGNVHSLKLTFSHLKMDGLEDETCPFGALKAYFQEQAVKLQECSFFLLFSRGPCFLIGGFNFQPIENWSSWWLNQPL